jgi:hypothetical protein
LCARKKLADALREVAGTVLAKANFELKGDKGKGIRLSEKFLHEDNIADDLSFLILRYSLSYYLSGEDNDYPKFKDNKHNYNCLEFFDNFWLPYLKSGVLYRDDIKKLDKNLFDSLVVYFHRHKDVERPARNMPTKQQKLEKFKLEKNDFYRL